MARPKSSDPKVSVTLSLRRSTVERIAGLLPEGQTVASNLSMAVEQKYGTQGTRGTHVDEVTPRPKVSR